MTIKNKKELYIDPSTNRKKDVVENKIQYHQSIPLFSLLEFNIFGACNRSCAFCPVSDTSFYKNVYQGIELKLYEKILLELKEVSYSGTILFSAFSEPLLNKKIYLMIEMTKNYLQSSKIEIVSNGDVIIKNNKTLKKLFDSGLDVLSISIYDGEKEFKYFEKLIKSSKIQNNKIILRRRYKLGGNYGITFSNRAGLVNTNKFISENEEKIDMSNLPLNKNCFYPFYQMVVDYNGDVLMCAHDWKKESIIGTVKEQNIIEIWSSNIIKQSRSILSKDKRTFKPCINCNVQGDIMGHINFMAWQKYYGK